MRHSKVYYGFDGATALTSAMLNVNYMSLKYDNLSVNVDGNTLTVTVPAENIRISDVAGKQAIHLNNTSNVDLGVLTPGVYLYEVVAGGTRVVGKFVK